MAMMGTHPWQQQRAPQPLSTAGTARLGGDRRYVRVGMIAFLCILSMLHVAAFGPDTTTGRAAKQAKRPAADHTHATDTTTKTPVGNAPKAPKKARKGAATRARGLTTKPPPPIYCTELKDHCSYSPCSCRASLTKTSHGSNGSTCYSCTSTAGPQKVEEVPADLQKCDTLAACDHRRPGHHSLDQNTMNH